MANYTMTLKTVLEAITGKTTPVNLSGIQQLFDEARGTLFVNFPMYDESHRIELQNLIMGKFITREICTTPYGRWQLMFNQKLMEIMPMYNTLYEAQAKAFPLIYDDINYTRTVKETEEKIMEKGTTDTTESEGNSTVDGTFTPGTQQLTTNIETPQSEIQSFLNNKYLNSADKTVMSGHDDSMQTTDNRITGTITRSGQDTDNSTRNVGETYVGKKGGKSYGEMLIEYKNNLFSIDQMILRDLEELFFLIY